MKLSEYIKNNDVELTEEQEQKLNELLGVKKTNKVWKPKRSEGYYYINSGGDIEKDYWDDSSYDERRFELDNIFKTEEEANFEIEKKKLLIELQRFADENNDEINWKDCSKPKFFIYFNYEYNVLCRDSVKCCRDMLNIYFSSEELAQQAIDNFGDRIKKYLLGVEE